MIRREPLNTANALLDDHRVPRKIVVRDNIRDLKTPNTRRQFGIGRRKRTEKDKKRRFIRD